MINNWLEEAVLNNAAWCDAMASSHDIPTDWNELTCVSEFPMPPFYPNIVTLKSNISIDEKIDSLGPQLSLGWGIKDSFNELDLANKGFAPVCDAHWYCRVPTSNVIDNEELHSKIETVSNQSELDRWVIAWGEGDEIFNSGLLENNCVELLYVARDDRVVSGLATNQSGNSVGISNAFGSPMDLLCCVNAVIARHPDKGIVGYGNKSEIAALSNIGFKEIGDLRIWLSQ